MYRYWYQLRFVNNVECLRYEWYPTYSITSCALISNPWHDIHDYQIFPEPPTCTQAINRKNALHIVIGDKTSPSTVDYTTYLHGRISDRVIKSTYFTSGARYRYPYRYLYWYWYQTTVDDYMYNARTYQITLPLISRQISMSALKDPTPSTSTFHLKKPALQISTRWSYNLRFNSKDLKF